MGEREWVGSLTSEWRGFVIPPVLAAARHHRDVDVVGGKALGQPVHPADLPDDRYTAVWDQEAKVVRLARLVPREVEVAPDRASTTDAEEQEETLELNRALGVPVAWLPDYHFRSDGSPGSGWRNRVFHVRLREALTDGRLRRERGDWLCRTSRRGGGELFSVGDREEELGTEEHLLLARAEVSCRACLDTCRRWADSSRKEG